MGYLTTITIYNDSADELEKNPKELAKKLTAACNGSQLLHGRDYDSLGNAANILTLQKPRHSDDHTLYMHAGNTVIDVYDVKAGDWSLNQFINEMEYHLKRLKGLQKSSADQKAKEIAIKHSELSTGTKNVLLNAQIQTMYDLLEINLATLSKLRTIDHTKIVEIINYVEKHEFQLKK